MLHEVRVYDGNGKLKRVISAEEVADEYWKKEAADLGLKTQSENSAIKAGKRKPSKAKERTCRQCSSTYYAKNKDSTYCSPMCRHKYWNARKPRIGSTEKECEVCKKKYIARFKRARFCSDPCRQVSYRESSRAYQVKERELIAEARKQASLEASP